MKNNSGLLKIFGFVVVAILIGIGVGWFASRPKTAPVPTTGLTDSGEPTAPTQSAATSPSAGEKPKPAAEPPTPIAIVLPDTPTAPDWSDKIGDILTADTEIPDKCKDMLKLYPTLPDEGKVEIVGHLNNLVADDDYAPMGKILINPKTPAAAGQEVLNDLFNRPNSLKIPLMLQVARTPGHPLAAAAHEDLVLLLEEDHGTDWARWEKTTEAWLQENPD